MAIEVEIKVKVENPAGLEDSILDNGGRRLRCESQDDVYFDHPQRSFAQTDEALRIRHTILKQEIDEEVSHSPERYELTYKGPKMDSWSKTREEVSVEVDTGQNMQTILESLGFTEVAHIRKERTYYRIADISLTIDYVEGLGWFLEAEQVVEEKTQMDTIRNKLFELLDTLLSEEYESIRKSYLELLLG